MARPTVRPHTLEELARIVEGTVHGDGHVAVRGVNGLAEANEGELSFFNNARYRAALKATKASAVLVNESALGELEGRPAIVVADPYLSFAKISSVFHPRPTHAPGIDPRAVVEPGAEIDPSATVMAFCFISRGAKIGPRAVLYPYVFVGEETSIGADALIYPGVVFRERVTLGDRAIVHPGAVLGGDGFGFAFDLANTQHFKIPQAGTVEIGRDVEIGSNSAIDRGTLGPTRIGDGSKLDNLVQVGHNATVGPLVILCGQVGVAGSSEIGMGAVLGGQVGLADHLTVAPGARFAAQSGILGDIHEPGDYGGAPARPIKQWLKATAFGLRADKTLREIGTLKRQVAELTEKLEALLKR